MKLYVYPPSPNAKKAIMANALVGLGIEEHIVDLSVGEHKTPEYLRLNPMGKVPVLQLHDGSSLWESNAIINRMAAEVDNDLWPKSHLRYDIMRWQFWEACHWVPALRPYDSANLFGKEGIDLERAEPEVRQLGGILDSHLESSQWLCGDHITTADLAVGAPLAYRLISGYPLDDLGNLQRWVQQMEALPAWQKANPKAT